MPPCTPHCCDHKGLLGGFVIFPCCYRIFDSWVGCFMMIPSIYETMRITGVTKGPQYGRTLL